MSTDPADVDWTETYKSLVTLTTEGFKFCALANGGAAVALLAYLGNIAGKGAAVPDMRWPMAAFLAGLGACGIAMLFAYLTQLKRLNLLAYRKPIVRDWRLFLAVLFFVVSLGCFCVGSWCAVGAFK
jgi:hypothetical protein